MPRPRRLKSAETQNLPRGRRPKLPVATPCASPPSAAARTAGLRYLTDEVPGIRRRRGRHGFRYLDPAGRPVREPATLTRIRGLAIPPAWQDVWICPDPRGHLQATGRDARRRKQYRYHPRWTALRADDNFRHMADFGRGLPRLRRRLDADLARAGLVRERVLALAVQLLQDTLIRIGNAEYARERGSYGLSTLRSRHVQVQGERARFEFTGKGGKVQRLELRDRRAARLLRRCQELPGQALFQYLDEHGERHAVSSEDVNAYLREAMGAEFSAKDFRTWGGSLAATEALLALSPEHAGRAPEAQMRGAIQAAAARLANTPAICRRHYVLPALHHVLASGKLHALWNTCRARRYLTRAECVLLAVCEGASDAA